MTATSWWRWLGRLVIPLALAATLVVDGRIDRGPSAAASPSASAAPTQIEVPSPDALTSSWFCPVVGIRATLPSFGETTSELLLTNMTQTPVSVSVELRGRTTGRQYVTAGVAPLSTGVVNIADYARDEIVGALVEASSGGLAVTRRFISPLGMDEARCSSVLAPSWYIPVGDTQADALGVIAIMNPLPRDAIVDLTFATEAEFGPFVAPALTGVVVPSWSTVAVNVGEHVRRRDVVAASVIARTGRIAVDSFVSYDGSVGRQGFAAELGSVSESENWLVPLAGIDETTHVTVRVFNPSDDVAQIVAQVKVAAADSDRVAFAVAAHDVAELTVEPLGELAPSLAPGSGTLAVPAAVPFAVLVKSQNGVPVVAWAETLVGSDANPLTDLPIASDRVEPDGVGAQMPPSVLAAQSGLATVPGIGQARKRWLVVVPAEAGAETFLIVTTDMATLPTGNAEAPGNAEASDNPPADSPAESLVDSRVLVETLNGETVAVLDVPASGVAQRRLVSGSTHLVTSDVPFGVLLWQSRTDSNGLSVAHPLGVVSP